MAVNNQYQVFKQQLIYLELHKEEVWDITIHQVKDFLLVIHMVTPVFAFLILSRMVAKVIFFTGDTLLEAECLFFNIFMLKIYVYLKIEIISKFLFNGVLGWTAMGLPGP